MFTKYDKLVNAIESRWEEEGREYLESDVEVAAAEYLKKHCIECIERLTGEHNIPYLVVSSASIVLYRTFPCDSYVTLQRELATRIN